MSNELPKAYDPKAVEARWYRFWLERGYFHADVDPARTPYCITIPPPNVTGELHMGHALQHSIHDLIIRWKRMQGFNTLCLPGTDHAGIATQRKVVQELAREGLTRYDIGREEFVKRCWEWTEKYGGSILNQLKSLGCSYDWQRTRFTLDDTYYRAVLTAFVHFYRRGWVYRGLRVVSWCPECQTTVSDLEVEHKTVESSLWHIRYPADDGGEGVVVATTRPETMLGDTAVAVNPADERYQDRVGKRVVLPLMDRPIPIVADDFVDREFGTGAVKVTPAHDPNDWEIGQRHNLPSIIVIGKDGRMTAEAGRFAGLDRLEARRQIVAELEAQALLVGVEPYAHSVGHHDKCGTVVEPLAMEQWFMRMRDLAQLALRQIREGQVRFVPERFAGAEVQWLENIRDWNISRQLWWGQRIPIWTCAACGEVIVQVDPPETCTRCNNGALEQDPDVFDTWFSSALWPFATLGWPEKTPELEYFYPTDLMITARDILYLWIARMMMCSGEFLGQEPFRVVMVHPTVQTHEGKRMSKSLGTGIDPLELTAEYGTDATRFGLIYQCGGSQDIRFSRDRLEMSRNFCNKLWNASRFVLLNLGDWPAERVPRVPTSGGGTAGAPPDVGPPTADVALPLADRWILSRLERTVAAVNEALAALAVDDAAQRIYNFVWDEFCDWYVELAKPRLNADAESGSAPAGPDVRGVLLYVLERTLRLAHPFMPFITEAIWQSLPGAGESLMIARYPEAQPCWLDEASEARMGVVMAVTRALRNLRAELGVAPSQRVEAAVIGANGELEAEYVEALARASVRRDRPAGKTIAALAGGLEVLLPVAGLVDAERERGRLQGELTAIEKELARVNGKLGNPQFVERAPGDVVEKERRIRAELEEKKSKLEERLRAVEA